MSRKEKELNIFKSLINKLKTDIHEYIESEIAKSDCEYTIYGMINTTSACNSKYLFIKDQLDLIFKEKDNLSKPVITTKQVLGNNLVTEDLRF